jgi:hypothetical protein
MVVAGVLVVTPDRPEFPEWDRTELSEPAGLSEAIETKGQTGSGFEMFVSE